MTRCSQGWRHPRLRGYPAFAAQSRQIGGDDHLEAEAKLPRSRTKVGVAILPRIGSGTSPMLCRKLGTRPWPSSFRHPRLMRIFFETKSKMSRLHQYLPFPSRKHYKLGDPEPY